MEKEGSQKENIFYSLYQSFVGGYGAVSLSNWGYDMLKGNSSSGELKKRSPSYRLVESLVFDGGKVACLDERFSDVLGQQHITS